MKCELIVILIVGVLTGCSTAVPGKKNFVLNNDNFSEKTVFVPISQFVDHRNNQLKELVITPLSSDTTSLIKEKLLTLPKFPKSSYSGCHARAHFDYSQLKESADGNLYKVWFLSSALLSPALKGAITYISDNGNQTAWDYHVAVAYVDTNNNEWVIDRLLSEEPILITDWVNRFNVEGYAVLTRVAPQKYLFNRTAVPVSGSEGYLAHFVPKNVFNGNFYTYSGASLEQHWGASDIAADALSSAFQNGEFPSCEWKNNASQSLKLKGQAVNHSVPVACESAQTLFLEQFELWKNRGL